jgi:hypothetical protein
MKNIFLIKARKTWRSGNPKTTTHCFISIDNKVFYEVKLKVFDEINGIERYKDVKKFIDDYLERCDKGYTNEKGQSFREIKISFSKSYLKYMGFKSFKEKTIS